GDELAGAGVADGARCVDQSLGIGAEGRVDLHGDRELSFAQHPLELRLARRRLEGSYLRALPDEKGARRAAVRIDCLANRRDLGRGGAAAAADEPRAELPRLRGELGEVVWRRVREDDALAGHAREADVRQ